MSKRQETLYIGVDTGGKGCFVVLTACGVVLQMWDYNEDTLADWCCDYSVRTVGVYERVWGRPGQGASATFKQGWNAGKAHLRLKQLTNEIVEITPAKWQKEFGLVKPKGVTMTKTEKKNTHVMKARELFPDCEHLLLKSKDGRADALLIAEYGRRLKEKELDNN